MSKFNKNKNKPNISLLLVGALFSFLILIQSVSAIITIELTNSYNLYPDNFIDRECVLTGNESYLWTCDVGIDYVDIAPVDTDLDDVIACIEYYENETCKIEETFSYPNFFTMYIGKGNDKELSVNVPLNKGTLIAGKVSQALDPYEPYYQLFDNPILIYPTTEYNTVDTNVTQENKFAHLNISDTDLVLYIPFDIPEDTSVNLTYDYSSNNNDGTLQNGVLFNQTGGLYGGAYEFDGVDDYISLGNVLDFPTDNFSVSAWININDHRNYNAILGRGFLTSGIGYGLYTYNSGTLEFQIRSGGSSVVLISSDSPLNTNEWYFVSAVRDYGGTSKLYVNGVEQVDTETETYNLSSIDDFRIGSNSLGNYFMSGSIDEVMIFNRSLSGDEINKIYNSTYSRFYPTGEMLFQNLNFGINNTVNISIPLCQKLNGSQLSFKINDGSFQNLDSNCQSNSYSISGNLTSANLTLKYNSTPYNFYSPVLFGNITLDDYFTGEPPNVTTINPNPLSGIHYYGYNYLNKIQEVYGFMSILEGDTTTVSFTTQNVYVNITENQTGDNEKRIQFINGTFIIRYAGDYQITSFISFSGSTGSTHGFSLSINGVKQDYCYSQRKLGSTDVGTTGFGCILTLGRGDVLTMIADDEDITQNDINIVSSNLNLHKIN